MAQGDILIKQLKNVHIAARAEWKAETRVFLLSHIRRNKPVLKKFSLRKNIINMSASVVRNIKMVRLAWRPAGVLAGALLFLILGSGMIMAAAQNAVPGEKMFVVKRVIEKGEVLLATNNAQEVELASAFLGNRVNELQKLMWQQTELVSAGGQMNGESGDIILAVEEVNKQLGDVKQRVEKLKSGGQQAGMTAMILNQKINTYRKELKQVKKKVTDKRTGAKLDEALTQVGDLNGNLLAVIVDKHQKGELKINRKEIEEKLTDHLSDIEEKTVEVKKQLAEVVLTDKNDVSKFKDKTKVVEEKINSAKQAIRQDKFNLVLSLAQDSNKILKMLYGEVDKVIDNSKAQQKTASQVEEAQVKGVTDEQTDADIDIQIKDKKDKADEGGEAGTPTADSKIENNNVSTTTPTKTAVSQPSQTIKTKTDKSEESFNDKIEQGQGQAVKSEFNVGIQ